MYSTKVFVIFICEFESKKVVFKNKMEEREILTNQEINCFFCEDIKEDEFVCPGTEALEKIISASKTINIKM